MKTTLKIEVKNGNDTVIQYLTVPSFFVQTEEDFFYFKDHFYMLFPAITGITTENINVEIVLDEEDKAKANEIGTELKSIILNENIQS